MHWTQDYLMLVRIGCLLIDKAKALEEGLGEGVDELHRELFVPQRLEPREEPHYRDDVTHRELKLTISTGKKQLQNFMEAFGSCNRTYR